MKKWFFVNVLIYGTPNYITSYAKHATDEEMKKFAKEEKTQENEKRLKILFHTIYELTSSGEQKERKDLI